MRRVGEDIMKVKVNYEVAEKINSIIINDQYKDWHDFEREIDVLENTPGIELMIDFYKSFDFSTYKEVLFAALNKSAKVFEDDFINSQYHLLTRIIDNKSKLQSKLNLIKQYDFSTLEKRLKEKLPPNTELDIEIYFVLDGINGGSIVGDGKMMINTMFWPSMEANLDLIEGILLHEYHHLGLLKWINKYDKKFDEYSDGIGMAKHLMISILSEGAATYFYNDGDDLFPLIMESHGEAMATQYRESMLNRDVNASSFISKLEGDLLIMIDEKEDYSKLQELRSSYSYSDDTEPLDKSIGYHMCSKVDQSKGLESLIDCFELPNKFFETYNESVQDLEEYKFTDDFMKKWAQVMA